MEGTLRTLRRFIRSWRTTSAGTESPHHLFPATSQIHHLEGFAEVPVIRPGLDYYLDRIRQGEPFAFVRRDFDYWAAFVDLQDESIELDGWARRGEPVPAEQLRHLLRRSEACRRAEARSGRAGFFLPDFLADL